MFYVILRIETGKSVYSGLSLTKASTALQPGTCYGADSDLNMAVDRASEWREKFVTSPLSV